MCIVATAVAVAVPAVSANAAGVSTPPPELTDSCVGLDCNVPATGTYVPEAHQAVARLKNSSETEGLLAVKQLLAQGQSGFYKMPAPVTRGGVEREAVVYLAKAGEFDKTPDSVRNLAIVRDFANAPGLNPETTSLVVVDQQMGFTLGAPRRTESKTTSALLDPQCPDRYFCVYESINRDPISMVTLSGPRYTGTGWHEWQPYGLSWGSSMENWRDGDSLLADLVGGGGTRYCARENSVDDTFANNPIGNGNASSWAMLRGDDNRC